MKKIFILFSLCSIFIFGGITLVACGENPSPETFTITLPNSSDYTVTANKEIAEVGQEVILTVTLLNNELIVENVFANDNICEENYDGTYSFTMPNKNVIVTVETKQIEEILSTDFVWFDDNNLYTITTSGDGTFSGDTRNLNVTFAYKQAMTIVKTEINSSNQNSIPNSAIIFDPVTYNDIDGANESNEIAKGIIRIDPFKINPGTSYLTMEFVNGNNSYDNSNRGTLVIKITVVPYGELTLEAVKETIVIDLFSELQYQTGSTFCLRIGDRDHVDGSSNPIYTDYVLTLESGRKLTLEFDYVLGHRFWIRLVESETQPDVQPGYIEEFIFDDSSIVGDVEKEYTGFYNNNLMYMDANDRVTIDAERNPALEN